MTTYRDRRDDEMCGTRRLTDVVDVHTQMPRSESRHLPSSTNGKQTGVAVSGDDGQRVTPRTRTQHCRPIRQRAYNCRNQLNLTITDRADGDVPFRIACRSLYTTYTNDNGANSQLNRAFSAPRCWIVLYW